MKMNYGCLIVLLCVVCTQAVQFLEKPAPKEGAAPEEPKKDAPPGKPKKGEPKKGGKKKKKGAEPMPDSIGAEPLPPLKDNFQDELVDQADNEFDLAARGDNCLTWEEMEGNLRVQFQEGAPDKTTMSEKELAEEEEIKGEMVAEAKIMYDHTDQNKDGCIDRAEYKLAGEMEGPPPGFQKEMVEEMGQEDWEEQLAEEEKFEFDAMDRSGDGKISKTEAYHYASENMPTAEVDKASMDDMFASTDKNGDGFITFDEFSTAGEAIEGDGNEMEKAPPMMFVNMRPLQWKKIKKAALKSRVRKHMLAHKPPLKVMSHFLGQQKKVREEPAAEKKPEAEAPVEEAPESPAESETAKGNETGPDPAVKEAAHKDNFQDELVDQADPEFDMMSGGDDCMTWDELSHMAEQQFQPRAPDMNSMTEEDQKDIDEMQTNMMDDLKKQYDHVDANEDGCVDKEEFEKAQEMEGPPPGFEQKRLDEMGEEDYSKEVAEQDKYEFDAMDRSGDQMVSKAEAYHYANENMPGADIDQKMMDEMFDFADKNKDGLLSYEEFVAAGEYKGDGNEMEKAEPMSFKIGKARKKSYLAGVLKRCLAQKPPLKLLAKSVSLFMSTKK